MPCNDGDIVTHDTIEQHVDVDHEYDHDHEDNCSPFCQCSCCSIHVINNIAVFSELPVNSIFSQINSTALDSLSKGFAGAILQPPQMIA